MFGQCIRAPPGLELDDEIRVMPSFAEFAAVPARTKTVTPPKRNLPEQGDAEAMLCARLAFAKQTATVYAQQAEEMRVSAENERTKLWLAGVMWAIDATRTENTCPSASKPQSIGNSSAILSEAARTCTMQAGHPLGKLTLSAMATALGPELEFCT
jgi:hypothetical protein